MTRDASRLNSSLQSFIPLIIILGTIAFLTLLRSVISHDWSAESMMMTFMGSFFMVFGAFKLSKLHDFAQAYAEYDLLAKQSRIYALCYPGIELSLGLLYLMHIKGTALNSVTLVLMVINSIGVARELMRGKTIMCACLGTVFKLPMTYVTLFEDMLMATMAFVMLFNLHPIS